MTRTTEQILLRLKELEDLSKTQDPCSEEYKETNKQHKALFHYLSLGLMTGTRTMPEETTQ